MHPPHVPPEVVELDTTFRSIDAGDSFDGRVLDFFLSGVAGVSTLVPEPG